MPILRSILLLLVALPVCRSATAQGERPAGHGTLTGVVRDSASGAPAPGLLISFGGRSARTDSSGRYVRNVSPGLHQLWILCPSSRVTVHEREQPVRIVPDSTLVLDLLVHPSVCTSPPDAADVELAGHYATGFEESSFVPCPGEAERAWGRPIFGKHSTWVQYAPGARETGPSTWPAPDSSGYSHRFFVRWRGRLAGPGSHGHRGASPYLFRVKRILEVRTPAPGDCG